MWVLNQMHDQIRTEDDATAPWVTTAISNPDVSTSAVESVMTGRFGKSQAYPTIQATKEVIERRLQLVLLWFPVVRYLLWRGES